MPTKIRLEHEKVRDQLKIALKTDQKLFSIFPLERLGRLTALCIGVDSRGDLFLHPLTGVGGNKKRRDDKIDNVKALKQKYHAVWGKRSTAKIIAFENKLSLRTVQSYFKEFP